MKVIKIEKQPTIVDHINAMSPCGESVKRFHLQHIKAVREAGTSPLSERKRKCKAACAIKFADTGAVKPYLNKSEAYRVYGRNKVDNWIKVGLITPRGEIGKSWQIDRVEIQSLASARTVSDYMNSQYFKSKELKNANK